MSSPSSRFTGKWIGQRYCIEQELGRGGMGAVYRAFHVDDPSNDVAIKLIHRNHKMSSSDLLRFQKEAALMSQLYHPNIIAFHELGILQGEESKDFTGGYYIVMDYARGKNLKESLTSDGRKDLAFLFQVGLQVADALDYTHGKNIIHRDIKPHNIIITQSSGDERGVHVRVLDFGVARLGDFIGREEGVQEDRAGTPIYMAPEQTVTGFGASDHRVDLYSLGCVLYEILIGHPPFSGENREALERAHQTAVPEPIQNLRPDVPSVVAQIIHKLLAKKPDERYQTAFSLSADLLRAKALWEAQARQTNFQLAQKDAFFAVSAQLPLLGREVEMNALLHEYQQVADIKARGRITVLTGAPGMGKTRMLNEFRSILAAKRIKFVSGLFTQHENALPFNALANAFNELLVKTAKTSPVDADILSRRLKQMIGPDVHLVATVVPGLKPFITEIAEPEDGTDIEGERYGRFTKAFSDFTKCLVPENQPLVMILDDCHWADDRSLALIDQFFSNANSLRFQLVIGARSASNLADSAKDSSFGRFLTKFRGLKLRYAEIQLGALNGESCQKIVAALLRSERPLSADLIDHLALRSARIPMRLVELTRRLVALDMIRLNPQDRGWEWDLQQIKGAKISLTAVDLVLGRIEEFKGTDLMILQAASVCGMSFQYENLRLNGKNSSSSVVHLIEKAINEGLVVRTPELPYLKHLGKAYTFVHKKVRDAIYDEIDKPMVGELHSEIARQMLISIEQPKDQMLFALVQHLNKSLSLRSEEDLDAKALKFNVEAGDAMHRKQGWTAANNYFRVATDIILRRPSLDQNQSLQRKITERLADVNVGQTNFKSALEKYADLLRTSHNIDELASVAAKLAQVHLVCGNISESISVIRKSIKKLGLPADLQGFERARMIATMLYDYITRLSVRSALMLGLRRIWLNGRQANMVGDDRKGQTFGDGYHRPPQASKLYHLLSIALARQSRRKAQYALMLARGEVVHGSGSIEISLRIMTDVVANLVRFTPKHFAYRAYETLERLAADAKIRRLNGYVAMSRSIYLDYAFSQMDEVVIHNRIAVRNFDRDQNRLDYANIMAFRMYMEFCSGKFAHLDSYHAEIRQTVPTRHWFTPVSMAILAMALLLQGKRQRLVSVGEEFIRRRKEVGGRLDCFSLIVSTLVVFARGEIDQSKLTLMTLLSQFPPEDDGEAFQPWQEDFINLFVVAFLLLLDVESPGATPNLAWARTMNRTLKIKCLMGRDRATETLIYARTSDWLKSKRERKYYDFALRKSKIEGHYLLQIFATFWLGQNLVASGDRRRIDYLNKSLKLAIDLKLTGLKTCILRSMELAGVEISRKNMQTSDSQLGASKWSAWPLAVYENLYHMVQSQIRHEEMSVILQQTTSVLQKLYPDATISILLADSVKCDPIIYSGAPSQRHDDLLRAVTPYFSIRSTLVLHMNPSSSHVKTQLKTLSSAMDKTISPESELESTRVLEDIAPKDDKKQVVSDDMMQGLVPIRVGGDTIGLIVIDQIGANTNYDVHKVKQDLDEIGVQIGLMMSQTFKPVIEYLRQGSKAFVSDITVMGSTNIEPCPWLESQLKGRLRTDREASWYLGLNWGRAQYLVVYCCAKGDAVDRDLYARMLLNQIFVVRELFLMRGQEKSELVDIRSQMRGLLSADGMGTRMDEIMFSYSLFEQSSDVVASGHYGPSRPVVLGVENRVTAFNHASMRLRDGRDLRYWEVYAQLAIDNVYLVSYDTSRIDGGSKNFVTLRSQSQDKNNSSKFTTKLLDSAVQQNVLPRYYLTVTRRGT